MNREPMAKTTTNKPKRKRARRKPKEETAYYVVAIENWEWSFSFGVSTMPEREGGFSDYRHLQIRGTLLRPSSVKANSVELTFLPDARLNAENRDTRNALGVGSVSLYRGSFTAILSMPSDALPLLLTMLTGDRLRYVILHGAKLRYGNAWMKDFRFEMNLGEDDLPAEA